MDNTTEQAASLRAEMLERFQGKVADDVAEAMLTVPRHVFVPGVPLERAYGSRPVVTHRDAQGVPTSSASAPGTVAAMLDQAKVGTGHRVLEIGAGTGYNAALLAHLVGPSGAVTTIEYDPEVADSARSALTAHGAERVKVVTGDGTLGSAEDAPFDRILVTAGAWDVATAWKEQLAPDGLLVLPLRLRGLTRVVAFEHAGRGLRSVSAAEDGFLPMKGIGAVAEQEVPVGAGRELTLSIDDERLVDADALASVLDGGPNLVWTGVSRPWAWTQNVDFWLAGLPGFCRVFVSSDAVAAGRVPRPKDSWGGSWGAFSGGTIAYLTARQIGGTDEMPMLEVGACGFGPDGAGLAQQLAERVAAWEDEAGDGVELMIEAFGQDGEASTDDQDVLVVVDKKDNTFVVRTTTQA